MSEYLTTKEVSERTRIPKGTLDYWRQISKKQGILTGPRFVQVSRRSYKYALADVNDFMESRKFQGRPDTTATTRPR